jgi:cell fate regulator YaaT (PSP1 superfamily)
MDPLIVGVRFQKVGKIYHFDAHHCQDLQPGDFAVVDTTRGRQLGEVIHFVEDPQPPPEGNWKPIQRKATPQDLVLRQSWQQKEIEAMINCRAKAAELRIPSVKIIAAEFSFDGSRLSLLYSSETGDKIDLRALRRGMQKLYPHSKVEMHQIGPRDVAKILGGMGACGLENRCCSMFLTEFSPISIKMAKDQGISLTPSEITGMCGRLRCCLVYEYEAYVEARKQLPKRGKEKAKSSTFFHSNKPSWLTLKMAATPSSKRKISSPGMNWKPCVKNPRRHVTATKAAAAIVAGKVKSNLASDAPRTHFR